MVRVAIVFHSVCGNTYLLARCFAEYLSQQGAEADLFRVADETYGETSLLFDASVEHREEILKIPVIEKGSELTGYDVLFLGSPTYFGCVSAQMKAFMDSFLDIWIKAEMAGKYFGCFTASATVCGGSGLCLQVMNTFAQHMGMIPVSVPCNIGGAPQPAYGISHAAGELSTGRPSEETLRAIRGYVDHVLKAAEGRR